MHCLIWQGLVAHSSEVDCAKDFHYRVICVVIVAEVAGNYHFCRKI